MTTAQKLQPIEVDEDILNDPHQHALRKEREIPLSKMQQKFVQLYVYQDLTNTGEEGDQARTHRSDGSRRG